LCLLLVRRPLSSTLFPYTTLFRSAIAFFRSGARTPAHAVIKVGDAEPRELAPGSIPADYPIRALVEPQAVTITAADGMQIPAQLDRKSTRLNSSHVKISYAVFCLK